jgi:hypothetical protein
MAATPLNAALMKQITALGTFWRIRFASSSP